MFLKHSGINKHTRADLHGNTSLWVVGVVMMLPFSLSSCFSAFLYFLTAPLLLS